MAQERGGGQRDLKKSTSRQPYKTQTQIHTLAKNGTKVAKNSLLGIIRGTVTHKAQKPKSHVVSEVVFFFVRL